MTTYRLELYVPMDREGGSLVRNCTIWPAERAPTDASIRAQLYCDGAFALLIELSLNDGPGVGWDISPGQPVRAIRDGERVPVLREHVAARYRVTDDGRVMVCRYPAPRTLAEREEELR